MIRAVFMDIDNTLLDFDAAAREGMAYCFQDAGLTYKPEMFAVFTEENNKIWKKIEQGILTMDDLPYVRWQTILKKLGLEATSKNMNDLKLQKAHEDKLAAERLAEAKALQEKENNKAVVQPQKQTAQPEHAQSIKEEKVLPAASADTEQEQQDSVDDLEDVFQQFDDADTDFEDTMDEEFEANSNSNEIILEMHRNGNSIIDIAKQLGLGVGEVKLVIDLYQGE